MCYRTFHACNLKRAMDEASSMGESLAIYISVKETTVGIGSSFVFIHKSAETLKHQEDDTSQGKKSSMPSVFLFKDQNLLSNLLDFVQFQPWIFRVDWRFCRTSFVGVPTRLPSFVH
jgi:hypothetical protein